MLATLPQRQRLPFQHVKNEGLSALGPAKLTGMSEPAVNAGIDRALKALATWFKTPHENGRLLKKYARPMLLALLADVPRFSGNFVVRL